MHPIKTLLLLFLIAFPALSIQSQSQGFFIRGKVLDQVTQQPLAGASVFCQNTTAGTISGADGSFSLHLANGGYDLVVSYTGYERQSKRISGGDPQNDSMVITLHTEDKAMGEVVVAGSAEVPDGWERYGKFFVANFIGTTPNADSCVVENKDVLHFYFYKKRNKLKVKAAQELTVTNHALGYRIHYQLDSFVYDYNRLITTYAGYPLFEVLTGSPDQERQWKKNRYRTYIGSRLHFMRCWYDSTLREEGYSLELLDNADSSSSRPLVDPYDSSIYRLDSGDVVLNIKGRLRVTYTGQVPDKKYLAINHFSPTARQQVSALDVPDGFGIEENGYFYDQTEVTNLGYWAWKKLAEQLPYDYTPD